MCQVKIDWNHEHMVIQNHIRISCLYSHLALEFGKPREESYDEIFVIFPQYKYMLMRNYETYPTNAIWLCGSPNIHLCVHHAIAIPWCCLLSSNRLYGRGHYPHFGLTHLCLDPFKWFLGCFLLNFLHLERLEWVDMSLQIVQHHKELIQVRF